VIAGVIVLAVHFHFIHAVFARHDCAGIYELGQTQLKGIGRSTQKPQSDVTHAIVVASIYPAQPQLRKKEL